MEMKKALGICLGVFFLLVGCNHNIVEREAETGEDSEEQVFVQNYQMDNMSYRLVLPFKQSEARGMVAATLNNRLDMNRFELGMMNLSKSHFSPNKYYFQEGQYLNKEISRSWLARKLEGSALTAAKKEDSTFQNLGLNPSIDTKGKDLETANEDSPIYLASILEQNYLEKNNKDELQLSGISIGLAMNSVHYFEQEQGYPRETTISEAEILKQGKSIAQEIVSRMRTMEGLENVPIFICIFKQEAASSIQPGVFLATSLVNKGESSIKSWSQIDENYVTFPSEEASTTYREDSNTFNNFKSNVEDYFPNYTGMIGTGHYTEGILREMTITVPVQFYSQTEITGFTQYVTSLVLKYYPKNLQVNIEISSAAGAEAVITKNRDADEPNIYIYQ